MNEKYESLLKQSKDKTQQLMDLYNKTLLTIKKEKEVNNNLKEENETKSRKIESLNSQLNKYRRTIDELNKTLAKK